MYLRPSVSAFFDRRLPGERGEPRGRRDAASYARASPLKERLVPLQSRLQHQGGRRGPIYCSRLSVSAFVSASQLSVRGVGCRLHFKRDRSSSQSLFDSDNCRCCFFFSASPDVLRCCRAIYSGTPVSNQRVSRLLSCFKRYLFFWPLLFARCCRIVRTPWSVVSKCCSCCFASPLERFHPRVLYWCKTAYKEG